MLLWSIQHRNVYEELIKTGVWRADEQYLCEEEWKPAYLWLAEQMKQRIGPPPSGTCLPIWAWYRWEGRRRRPDMRLHSRNHGEKGTPIVLLTLDIPDHLVLLSDFDYWHHVLNNWEITAEEDDKVYTQAEKEHSWALIFDIECTFDPQPRLLTTQATFWEIRKSWLIKAEHFSSR